MELREGVVYKVHGFLYILYCINVYCYHSASNLTPFGSFFFNRAAKRINQRHDGSHRCMDTLARLCGPMHEVFFKTIFRLADFTKNICMAYLHNTKPIAHALLI